MEYIKEKLPTVIGIIIFIVLCAVAYYFLFVGQTIYYTKIDNTKVEELSTSDDMKYQYTLDCYKGNGSKKVIKFKTSRELREDAYLMLEYMEVSGVHSWKEVQFEELPDEVQSIYKK